MATFEEKEARETAARHKRLSKIRNVTPPLGHAPRTKEYWAYRKEHEEKGFDPDKRWGNSAMKGHGVNSPAMMDARAKAQEIHEKYGKRDESPFENIKRIHSSGAYKKHAKEVAELEAKEKKESVAKKMSKKYHPSEYHKELGTKIFGSTGGTPKHLVDKFLDLKPEDRGRVNVQMGRLHRRKERVKGFRTEKA